MNQERALELMRESDAFLEGHFQLSSGKHSDRYFQCALVLQWPERAAELAGGIAEQVRAALTGPAARPVDVVVGPAMGAVVWAQEVGRALGVRALFTERQDGRMVLRRSFRVEPGERVLVVEDVLTTGGSAREVIALLRGLGAEVVGVGAIVNRTGGNPYEDLGLPLFALAAVDAGAWEPDECALCAAGSVATKPGSRPTVAGTGRT